MPMECRARLSEKEGEDIWVHGVYYAPASVIRRANVELQKDRYVFLKDTRDDREPCPQYKAALGKCPSWLGLKIVYAEVLWLTSCI